MAEKIKIGVFSPYPEFSRLIKKIGRDFNAELIIEQLTLGDAVKVARKWLSEEAVDVVVARGPTAQLVKETVDLPVSVVDITNFDVMNTLHQAKVLYGAPIGFIDHKASPFRFDFDTYKEMLSMDFKIYSYKNDAELQKQIKIACREGVKTIIATGSCIAEKARAWDVRSIFVHSNEEAIRGAMARAVQLAAIKRENKVSTDRLSTILKSMQDGLLALDKDGTLFFCNPRAGQLLGLSREELLCKNVSDLESLPNLKAIYDNGAKISGEIIIISGREFVVSRMPVKISGGGQCLVINFQVMGKLRQQLHDKGLLAKYHFKDIVGGSPALTAVIAQARKYAKTGSTIMITGESGTGKELFAQSIHNESSRRSGPFVAVNCAALPDSLLESVLFGYEEGAFTGAAHGGRPGLFELAHGGTIFMDEISELYTHLQARLLRIIQQKEVMRVGGSRLIPVDVRIMAASNRNLSDAVKMGLFREDLYYRLNVLNLHVPPLRERTEDIPVLFLHFLNKKIDIGFQGVIPKRIFEELGSYAWTGNVRELENLAERYCAIGEEDPKNYQTLQQLISRLVEATHEEISRKRQITVDVGTVDEIKTRVIGQMAGLLSGSKENMAKKLGISRTTLWRRLKTADQDIAKS
ncbi:MAG: sigma 54-interacting transcriptional regulator [Desulfocucumaceae bacterium]